MASKGKIDDVFTNNLKDLTTQDGQQGKASRGYGPRKWNIPETSVQSKHKDAGALDLLDIAGITAGFDRENIDTNYAELIQDGTDPGTCGDVISVKTQGDYIAIMERAFRARHATPVRCIAHAMGRRFGHSYDAGVFLGGVLKHVQDALQSGQG